MQSIKFFLFKINVIFIDIAVLFLIYENYFISQNNYKFTDVIGWTSFHSFKTLRPEDTTSSAVEGVLS